MEMFPEKMGGSEAKDIVLFKRLVRALCISPNYKHHFADVGQPHRKLRRHLATVYEVGGGSPNQSAEVILELFRGNNYPSLLFVSTKDVLKRCNLYSIWNVNIQNSLVKWK